ncbi:MAG TPA: hypothetical protein VM889_10165 [Candidatus Thermoplasmatota archaeon]|nr:hypothetical protein [Candidatus Thermoplasmatota archaeon]
MRGVPPDATLVVTARATSGSVRMSVHDAATHGMATLLDSWAQDADHGAFRLQARPGGRDWDVVVDPGPGASPAYRIVVTFEAYRKEPAFGVPIQVTDLGPWWCPLNPTRGCLP